MRIQEKFHISIDGIIGPDTDRNIRAFQRRQGLVVDGIVGPMTARRLGLTPVTYRQLFY